MTESILFHVSTFLVSAASSHLLDTGTTAFDSLWQWVEIILDFPECNTPWGSENHPVLATPWRLNRVIFEISRLKIQALSFHTKQSDVTQLLDVLDELETRSTTGVESYDQTRDLYITCARLLLLTVRGSGACKCPDENEKVETLKRRALETITDMQRTPESMNFMLRWPLAVLGNLLNDAESQSLVKHGLELLWQDSSCGDVRRAMQGLISEQTQHREPAYDAFYGG
jgi:hypothetical protein